MDCSSLSSYSFEIRYRSDFKNADADGLSRISSSFDNSIEANTIGPLSLAASVDVDQSPPVYNVTDPDTAAQLAVMETAPDETVVQAFSLSSTD